MKVNGSIYRLFLLAVLLSLATACKGPETVGEETPPAQEEPEIDARGYDPLELPGDRQVVPQEKPQAGAIEGKGALVTIVPEEADTARTTSAGSSATTGGPGEQVYRVQLFTSKVYGEARRVQVVAEEIFDRPVYLDYEVPYYKVRVGDFADRDKAEQYQQKVKTAGYENAWVVLVNVGVKEARPLYETPQGEEPQDTAAAGSDEAPND